MFPLPTGLTVTRPTSSDMACITAAYAGVPASLAGDMYTASHDRIRPHSCDLFCLRPRLVELPPEARHQPGSLYLVVPGVHRRVAVSPGHRPTSHLPRGRAWVVVHPGNGAAARPLLPVSGSRLRSRRPLSRLPHR